MTARARAIGGVLAMLVLVAVGLVLVRSGPRSTPTGGTGMVQAAAQSGQSLYLQSCATCHGVQGQGTTTGPALVDAGAAGADFMLSTGRMPLANPGDVPVRKPPAFTDAQIQALVAYVASMGNGPGIPTVVTDDAELARGAALFINTCAACHGAQGQGDAIGGGYAAPPLDQATPVQVAEAMRTGPGAMPVFDDDAADTDAIASYVEYLRAAPATGGLPLSGGTVAEGLLAVVVGLGLLVLIVRRIEPPRPPEPR